MRSINSCTPANKFVLRLLTVLLCAALLGGCSNPTPSASAVPDITGSAAPAPMNSLVLPILQGTDLANPLVPATREISSLYGLIYDSLLTTDDGGNIVPNLAETWTESDDGLKYTFTLRKNIKWQGISRELQASDVTYTLDQIKALGTDNGNPWGFVTKQYVKNWKANDDGTLTVTLYKPFYGALLALTFPVIPEGCGYDGGAAPAKPVGTGPYVVTATEKGKSISLSANPDWWKKQTGVKSIKALSFPDNATEISSLTLGGGQLDAMQTEDLTVTQYRDSGDANVYEYPTRYFEFLALNFSSPDILDKKIRQAIAYALNRKEIVSYTYVNHAIVCDTPIPPDSWLYNGKVLTYDTDLDRAKELIMLTGWKDTDKDGFWDTSPDGVKRDLKFKLLANIDQNNTLRNDAAILIAGQLQKVGIRVEVDAQNFDNYKTALQQGRFDLAMCGCYLSQVPDYTFLVGTQGALNYGKYSNSDMDAALAGVMQAPTIDALQVKISDLQSKIIDELPIICLYFRTHSFVTSPAIKGVSGVREESAYSGISQWVLQ